MVINAWINFKEVGTGWNGIIFCSAKLYVNWYFLSCKKDLKGLIKYVVETLVFLLEMLSLELSWKHFKSFPENSWALVMTWLTGLPKINNYGFQSGVYRTTSKEREENLQGTYLLFYFFIWNINASVPISA